MIEKKISKKERCAYPGCTHMAKSRGRNKSGKRPLYGKWCGYHQKGKGKAERQAYTAEQEAA